MEETFMAAKLEKATTVDIVLSCLLPFWGIVVGFIALAKGEKKRAGTMILISGILLAAWIIWRLIQPVNN